MDKVINLGIPHAGELIFESIDTPGLIQCALVSETWKVLAENVLAKRWKGRMLEACEDGETKVVQLLLERFTFEENGLNIRDALGHTPFLAACAHGHKDVVQLLLDKSEGNINLNARNVWGETALVLACRGGHTGIVQLLLESSDTIEVDARAKCGSTLYSINICLL